jgi:hypothetical protein
MDGKPTGVKKDSATNLALAFNWRQMSVNLDISLEKGCYKKLHFRNLFIHLFHELNNKIDKLMLQHFFSMEVGDEK